MSIQQRIRDWRHERHIKRLTQLCIQALALGERELARRINDDRTVAIRARSPGQIARMERAAFLRLDPAAQRTFLKHAARPE